MLGAGGERGQAAEVRKVARLREQPAIRDAALLRFVGARHLSRIVFSPGTTAEARFGRFCFAARSDAGRPRPCYCPPHPPYWRDRIPLGSVLGIPSRVLRFWFLPPTILCPAHSGAGRLHTFRA